MKTQNDRKKQGDVSVARRQKDFATDKRPEKNVEKLVLETDPTKPEDARKQN